jgi:tripeptidyl-peptidase-1
MRSLFLIALAGIALAAPSPRLGHVLHEKRAAEPVDWHKDRRLHPDKILPMRFGLSQQNLHRLGEILMSVSHPESPAYGQHLSPAEVVETFAPSNETIKNVMDWLVGSGFTRDRLRLTANRGWVEVNATTAEVEDLLNTEYHVYRHPSGVEQFG